MELAAEGSLYSEYSALRPCVEHTLAAIPLPFKRSHMAWVGGSLFATEKVMKYKYILVLKVEA